MRHVVGVVASLALACAGVFASSPGVPFEPVRPLQSDLDDFMSKVLAKRDENWKKLKQYVLDERQRIEVRGPANVPIWGDNREFTWFIRDGFFVQSPLKANGVTISEADRGKYEDDYLKRAKARDKKREKQAEDAAASQAGQGGEPGQDPEKMAPEVPKDMDSFLSQVRQPGFVDSAYFLGFKFEQGKYALVGKETFDGRDVLRIEYYPSKLFSHEQETEEKRKAEKKPDRGEDFEAQLEKMMNKVSLVTIWVEPAAQQIVKYTFDNVNLDFLPGAWLLRMNDLKATMTMSQPFKDVWLPRDIDFFFEVMLAVGAVNVRYHLDYYDYRQASTSGRIKGPGGSFEPR